MKFGLVSVVVLWLCCCQLRGLFTKIMVLTFVATAQQHNAFYNVNQTLPLLFALRGDANFCPNTLPSFVQGLSSGAHGLAIDLRFEFLIFILLALFISLSYHVALLF